MGISDVVLKPLSARVLARSLAQCLAQTSDASTALEVRL
jgi:hypothetical protein